MSKAQEIVREARQPKHHQEAGARQPPRRAVVGHAAGQVARGDYPPNLEIKAPAGVENCNDNAEWYTDIDLHALDLASWPLATRATPTTARCRPCRARGAAHARRGQRRGHGLNIMDESVRATLAGLAFAVQTTPRGPQTDGEWPVHRHRPGLEPGGLCVGSTDLRAGASSGPTSAPHRPRTSSPRSRPRPSARSLRPSDTAWQPRAHTAAPATTNLFTGHHGQVRAYSWIFDSALGAGVSPLTTLLRPPRADCADHVPQPSVFGQL